MKNQPDSPPSGSLRLVLIGPCVSGKSTVSARLRELGLDVHSAAQEHTTIHDLYRHQRPYVLVYLDVSYQAAARRREIAWGPQRHVAQKDLLAEARAAAHLVIDTDELTPEGVVQTILGFLRRLESSSEDRLSSSIDHLICPSKDAGDSQPGYTSARVMR